MPIIIFVDLYRKPSTDEGTFGTWEALKESGEKFKCLSLELPWRDNQKEISCIQPRIYECVWAMSSRLKKETYEVQGVVGHDGIRVHKMNWAGDKSKGFYSDSEGCIGLGESEGPLKAPNGKMQNALWGSKKAYDAFIEFTGKEPFLLRIHDLIDGGVLNY